MYMDAVLERGWMDANDTWLRAARIIVPNVSDTL